MVNAECAITDEHIKHIVVECTTIARSAYTDRHNKLAGYIYWAICKCKGLQVTDKYYEKVPEKIVNVNGPTIIWDIPVITDQTITAN
jgi:hypothetical protein